MNSAPSYIDVMDRKADYESILEETWRTEIGLRAISFMYDDHSDDKNSYRNILILRDNIKYRLFSASYQYLIFLREINGAEEYLHQLYKKDPQFISKFQMGNPYFERVEQELSSVFDNIVFQISSLFDYLSHIICYISFNNKSNSLYWTRLAKASRGQSKDFANEKVKQVIDAIDRRFVGKLYDYRSRLLHNKRDEHRFAGKVNPGDLRFHLAFIPSDIAIKHFNLILEGLDSRKKVTLTYLASWLVKHTLIEIENILDIISIEIRTNSNFSKNIHQPKREEGFLLASFDSSTKSIQPVSDGLWREYKSKRK